MTNAQLVIWENVEKLQKGLVPLVKALTELKNERNLDTFYKDIERDMASTATTLLNIAKEAKHTNNILTSEDQGYCYEWIKHFVGKDRISVRSYAALGSNAYLSLNHINYLFEQINKLGSVKEKRYRLMSAIYFTLIEKTQKTYELLMDNRGLLTNEVELGEDPRWLLEMREFIEESEA
jgi:hypothetical protein